MTQKNYNHYNPKLKNLARKLRTESVSKAEKFIWRELLSRKQLGYGFKRQRPISNYIVDFFCADLNLIIEIDGSSHYFKGESDAIRQENLKTLGYTVVRFTESEVMNDFDNVETSLRHTVKCLEEEL